jgi:hypothetical protein
MDLVYYDGLEPKVIIWCLDTILKLNLVSWVLLFLSGKSIFDWQLGQPRFKAEEIC